MILTVNYYNQTHYLKDGAKKLVTDPDGLDEFRIWTKFNLNEHLESISPLVFIPFTSVAPLL